jgi:phosphohistidine phosphatase SixA
MLDLQHTKEGSKVIFDFIEWDEHNLDHATRRLTASEIEQVIWNADTLREHRTYPDRVLFSSTTDGGKKAVVVAQIVRDGDGVRPITAWEEQ